MKTNAHKAGFTLIELSIVLVIIGLLVGGVLVGNELIEQAEVRSAVSQLERYRTATYTFRDKFRAMPGDIEPQKATAVGLFGSNGSSGGFGNGYIDGGAYYSMFTDERYIFWRHLSEAGLIQEQLGNNPTNPLNAGGTPTTPSFADAHLFMPTLKYDGFIVEVTHAYRVDITNATPYEAAWNDFSIYERFTGGATPLFSYLLDAKVDDGMPNTGGTVDLAGIFLGGWAATATDGKCTFNGADEYDPAIAYNVQESTGGKKIACFLYSKTGF